jgi:hypothetical protein
MTDRPNPQTSETAQDKALHNAQNSAPHHPAQNTLAQNENPMSSTLTPEDFETQLTAEDHALVLQLTYGLEQRSATAPTVASEAILRNITGRSAAVDRNRKRKLARFTVAVATLAGTPFVVRPAITVLRGEERPVVVATSSSAMPKYIVSGLDEKDIQSAYVSDPKAPRSFGTKQLRLRRGNASIEIATFGGHDQYQGPNGEEPEVTSVQIGAIAGKRVVLPSGNSIDEATTFYNWSVPEGELSASAEGIIEPELLPILASITRTPFAAAQETIITIGTKNGFVQVGEATDPVWQYFVSYGPRRSFSFDVSPGSSLAEDSYAQAKKVQGTTGRDYAVSGNNAHLTWIDATGAVLRFGVGVMEGGAKPLSDGQFNEMVKLADSVIEVDDDTFAKVVTSRMFKNRNNSFGTSPRKAPTANVLDGTIDGVPWRLTAGETPLEKECQKITFSGPAKPVTDCIPENPKDEFVSLGAASVGAADPKTVVFGVVKDTLEIIRVRNSAGAVLAEDFSIENGYLDGRAFAIELPADTIGEVTIEGYSYDDDVADGLPEGQFLPDDAKPLAGKTLTVE